MIVGSLIFCERCGNLLSLPELYPTQGSLRCDQCHRSQKFNVEEHSGIVTRSNPAAFPSALRQKRSLVQHSIHSVGLDKDATAPMMQESCPKCKHPEMKYHTLQLRSADEGTTVFYECPKCAHKFSTNN